MIGERRLRAIVTIICRYRRISRADAQLLVRSEPDEWFGTLKDISYMEERRAFSHRQYAIRVIAGLCHRCGGERGKERCLQCRGQLAA